MALIADLARRWADREKREGEKKEKKRKERKKSEGKRERGEKKSKGERLQVFRFLKPEFIAFSIFRKEILFLSVLSQNFDF